MESAQYYIDTDDVFCLSHLPCLDDLLEWGLTVFVDQIFPKYNDMTLTQFAAARRKPETFNLMLNRQAKCQIPIDDILCPSTSNTKENLFELAIKFGTKGLSGDRNDIRCLNILYNFIHNYQPNFDINFSEINGEAPLLTAIRCNNEDAIKFLMANKADLFSYKIKENEDEKTAALRMPIIRLFRSNKREIESIFDQILGDYKDEIIQKCLSLEINHKPFVEFLRANDLIEAENYLLDFHSNDEEEIHALYGGNGNEKVPKPETKPGENQSNDQADSENLCSHCHQKDFDELCPNCRAKLCYDCLPESNHDCKKS